MSDDPITYGTQTGDGFYCVPGGKPLTTAPEQYGWPTDAVLAVQAADERAEKAEERAERLRAALEVYATPALGCHHWSGSSARDAIAADDAAKG